MVFTSSVNLLDHKRHLNFSNMLKRRTREPTHSLPIPVPISRGPNTFVTRGLPASTHVSCAGTLTHTDTRVHHTTLSHGFHNPSQVGSLDRWVSTTWTLDRLALPVLGHCPAAVPSMFHLPGTLTSARPPLQMASPCLHRSTAALVGLLMGGVHGQEHKLWAQGLG